VETTAAAFARPAANPPSAWLFEGAMYPRPDTVAHMRSEHAATESRKALNFKRFGHSFASAQKIGPRLEAPGRIHQRGVEETAIKRQTSLLDASVPASMLHCK
jgi:hypothetical protein